MPCKVEHGRAAYGEQASHAVVDPESDENMYGDDAQRATGGVTNQNLAKTRGLIPLGRSNGR